MNDDGAVTNIDALMILKYVVGDLTAEDLHVDRCNVNGDGEVNNFDAQMVLEYVVGDIDGFPVN